MRLAVQPGHEDGQVHLPHQGLWFVLLLVAIWILLGKDVGAGLDGQRGNQWVIAYSSTLMPIA